MVEANRNASGAFLGTDYSDPSLFVVKNSNGNQPDFILNSLGAIRRPNQPFFSAFSTQILDDATGGGRTVSVVADRIISNIGGGYNAETGKFTAPATGTYLLNCKVRIGIRDFDGMRQGQITLNAGDWTYRHDFGITNSPTTNTLELYTFSASWLAPMKVGDVAQFFFQGLGGATNLVDIAGHPSIFTTGYSGYLLG